MGTEAEILKAIADDHPSAGELYIKETHPRWGKQREVHGYGKVDSCGKRSPQYICCVGSKKWNEYADIVPLGTE